MKFCFIAVLTATAVGAIPMFSDNPNLADDHDHNHLHFGPQTISTSTTVGTTSISTSSSGLTRTTGGDRDPGSSEIEQVDTGRTSPTPTVNSPDTDARPKPATNLDDTVELPGYEDEDEGNSSIDSEGEDDSDKGRKNTPGASPSKTKEIMPKTSSTKPTPTMANAPDARPSTKEAKPNNSKPTPAPEDNSDDPSDEVPIARPSSTKEAKPSSNSKPTSPLKDSPDDSTDDIPIVRPSSTKESKPSSSTPKKSTLAAESPPHAKSTLESTPTPNATPDNDDDNMPPATSSRKDPKDPEPTEVKQVHLIYKYQGLWLSCLPMNFPPGSTIQPQEMSGRGCTMWFFRSEEACSASADGKSGGVRVDGVMDGVVYTLRDGLGSMTVECERESETQE